ncbi:MAG: poly(3-hydroxybutyrate) depolymerase [Myxococcota bacterium]
MTGRRKALEKTMLLILLAACDATDKADDDTTIDTNETTDTTPVEVIEPPPYSGGTCPAMEQGWNSGFVTGEYEREYRLELPENPEGAPVIFLWHWLGGDADQIIDWAGFDGFPDTKGVILIAPETRGLQFEWDSFDGADTPDLLMFDDLLSCLSQQYSVDMTRIYASGMSAGGLWTVTLTNHRSQWLAASAPLSGGATEMDWAPDDAIPMLLTWGGPTDTYGSFSFNDSQYDLIDQVESAGQFAVLCEHDDGHSLPPGGVEYVWDFFEAHPKGIDSEPWADVLPDSLPEWCRY